jgi:energy-coupling factor transport system substrate-specific component
VALLAGAAAGVVASVYDAFVWYPGTSWTTMRLPYIAITAVSSLIIAGLGSVLLVRALAQTGVLDRFAAGRSRALV